MKLLVKKISIFDLDGKEKDTIELPKVFELKPRLDLIERAVISSESASKQVQGRDPLAGKRNTAESWGSGSATARIPRKKGSGYSTARSGTFAPNSVGGRLAHPPRAEKIIIKRINSRERHLALLSAISATEKRELVEKRGHAVSELQNLPIVIDDKIQTIKKTNQIIEILEKIGLSKELARVKDNITIRAGKGKRRGRKYKKRKGPLIVIKENFGVYNAARNIPGVEIINVDNINCILLAPGTHAGRLTIWTQSAFNALNKLEVN